jgi:tetratricopeptide (TPR) repeat protein
VQQHLCQGLGEAERRLLHRRVGEALERLYEGRREEVAVELARHFTGDPERERRYARLAGDRAAAQFASEEAVRYLSRALELTPADEHRERYELLLARERVHSLLGQRDAQRQDLAEMEELADGLGTEEQVELLMRRGQAAWWVAARAEAEQQFHAALELARATGDRRLEAQALSWLGQVRHMQSDFVGAERLFQDSMACAEEAGDTVTQALSVRYLGIVALCFRRTDEASNWVELSRALSEKIGDRRGLAEALRALGHVAWEQGNGDKAKQYYDNSLTLAEEIGDCRNAAAALAWLGSLVAARQDAFAEARTYCERSKAIAEEIGDRKLGANILDTLGLLACREGAYDEAETYRRQLVGLCHEIGDLLGLVRAQAKMAYVLALQGRQDAGWDLLLQDLREHMAAESFAQLVAGVLEVVGQMGVHAGRFQRGAELLGLGFSLDPLRSQAEAGARLELDMLQATLGAAELEAAMARGTTLDLDQVVADILTCETPEAYWGVTPLANKRS